MRVKCLTQGQTETKGKKKLTPHVSKSTAVTGPVSLTDHTWSITLYLLTKLLLPLPQLSRIQNKLIGIVMTRVSPDQGINRNDKVRQ
jgi:hypothetical protein